MDVRSHRRATIGERVKSLEQELQATRLENARLKHRPWLALANRKNSLIAIVSLIVIGGAVGTVALRPQSADPVPVSIRHALKFDVYYPKDTVPKSHAFNSSDFSIQDNGLALTFAVGVPGGPNLVISEQTKPTSEALALFYKTRMPLTVPIYSPVGTAQLGGLNNETVVSLPTTTNTWIIATAPFNADQGKIKQILSTMTIAR